MDQDATWYAYEGTVGLGQGHIVLDGDPVAPPPEKGHSSPDFRPISIVANGCPSQLLLSTCN